MWLKKLIFLLRFPLKPGWVARKAKLLKYGLDILFPRRCFGCQKEREYLCQDCQAVLEISGYHRHYQTQNLKDLYFAADYQNPLIKNLIRKFKYEPFIKELGEALSSLIIAHFQLLNNKPNFLDFVLVSIPLDRGKLKWRGFDQAEVIGKRIACFLNVPLISGCLIKIKKTIPQIELTDQERKENIKEAFLVKDTERVKDKKILLVDDVYTTGSTMEECARTLKKSGAKEIIGIVIARD